jgi:hypothetical protein
MGVKVDVIDAGGVELHHGLVLVPKQGLDLTHLFPGRASLDLLKAAIADGDTDVLPFGAGKAWAFSICGDAEKAVRAGRDEKGAVSVAVV